MLSPVEEPGLGGVSFWQSVTDATKTSAVSCGAVTNSSSREAPARSLRAGSAEQGGRRKSFHLAFSTPQPRGVIAQDGPCVFTLLFVKGVEWFLLRNAAWDETATKCKSAFKKLLRSSRDTFAAEEMRPRR